MVGLKHCELNFIINEGRKLDISLIYYQLKLYTYRFNTLNLRQKRLVTQPNIS